MIRPRPSARRRLLLEGLEDRTLLSVGPIGPQFQVNTSLIASSNADTQAKVAMDPAGDFVVV
jgi:hypothetical protein